MGAKIARTQRLGDIRTYQNAFGRAIEQTWSMSCVIGSLSQEKILNGFLRDYSRLHNCAGIGRRNDGLAREVMALVSISLLHRSICWSELQGTQWRPLLSVFLAVAKATATGERCSSESTIFLISRSTYWKLSVDCNCPRSEHVWSGK